EIVNLPSVSTIAAIRQELAHRQPADKTVAVFADPVFMEDDQRVKAVAKNQEPATEQERAAVERIRALKKVLGEKVTEADSELYIPRLPGTRLEAERILSLAGEEKGKEAIDFAANRANAISPELSHYRIIHFATHGFINGLMPQYSGIVLSLVDA